MIRFLGTLNIFARIAMVFSVLLIIPVGVSWWLNDGAITAFDEALLGTQVVAGALTVVTWRFRREMQARDAILLGVMTWVLLPLIGAVPIMLAIPNLGFMHAYFEAVSGLTATGATVLSGLDALPPSINLWRTQLHWIGGLGIVVLAVAVLPMLGVGGRQLMKAEVPGPIKDAKLTPRIAQTAKGFWLIYVSLTMACTFAYRYAGMSWIDGVTHAFSTVSLGGFSSHDASIGYFNSRPIEWITIFFALVSGISYATHFVAFAGKSLRPYFFDREIGYYFLVLIVSIALITGYLIWHSVYSDFHYTFRHVAFNTVSLATTLGYASTDYGAWPFFTGLWLLFLGSFVTCSASTGGGIKMMRAIILYKQVFREIMHALHPRAVSFVKLGQTMVSSKIIFAVLGFAFLYMVCTIGFVLVLLLSGMDIISAFSATVACFNNIGPGLGQVGPAFNYGGLTGWQAAICSLAMLLGRLEILTLLIVLTPAFWKK